MVAWSMLRATVRPSRVPYTRGTHVLRACMVQRVADELLGITQLLLSPENELFEVGLMAL